MTERNGRGFRERIQFDEPLWRDIEALSDHLRLKPADVVRMLTAMGAAQMKQITGMGRLRTIVASAVEEGTEEDVDQMMGLASTVAARPAPARQAPGRDEPQQQLAPAPQHQMVRAPQQQMVHAPQQQLAPARQQPADDGGLRYRAATYLENPRR